MSNEVPRGIWSQETGQGVEGTDGDETGVVSMR